ncbi:MAG TPA: hypothetical protein VND99_05170 [Candidatus Acidoferrales bacterium]|nr:hypothetical protein [Candidatus Acidoferrales bacterium]
MSDPFTGATGDAMADAIGGLFELPEVDLDNQLVEIASGEGSTSDSSSDTEDTNAIEGDGSLDAALIDLIPTP